MLKRMLLLTLLAVLLIPVAVQAQNEVHLAYLQVDLWPEYDRPEMLVILRAQLAPDVSLPVDVVFRIPAAVGEPNAVAVRQPDGALLNAMYERQEVESWAYVTVTATNPEIQLEYYDPGLDRSTEDRHYEFSWVGDYDVDSMVVQVQQPVGASQLRVEPNLGSLQAGTDNLQYYIMEIGAPKAGDEISVSINYTKTDAALSIEGFQIQPSAPIAGSAQEQSRFDWMTLLPWALGGLGVLLVVGGLFWYWRSGQEPVSKTSAASRRHRKQKRKPTSASSNDAGVYCHQCGKRAAPGDRFCRACGTRLRTG